MAALPVAVTTSLHCCWLQQAGLAERTAADCPIVDLQADKPSAKFPSAKIDCGPYEALHASNGRQKREEGKSF